MGEPNSMPRGLLAAVGQAESPVELAERICRACVEAFDVDGAALSVLTDSPARETLFATDATIGEVEELQYTLGEGACVQAAVTGRMVLVPDIGEAQAQWPVFAAAVAERTGVGALFALPLQLGTINLGVLDLYRATPGSLEDSRLREATSVAELATMLLVSPRFGSGDELWAEWSASRHAEVHQATGMLIAQLGVGAQEAFARLRGYAFAQGRLLSDVAGDVVARRVRFADNVE